MYFTDFDLYSSPKTYSKSLVKVGIERVMFILKKNPLEVSCQLSKEMVFMPLEKTGNNQCLMYFYRL